MIKKVIYSWPSNITLHWLLRCNIFVVLSPKMIVQLGLAQDRIYSGNHSDTKWCLQPIHRIKIYHTHFTKISHT